MSDAQLDPYRWADRWHWRWLDRLRGADMAHDNLASARNTRLFLVRRRQEILADILDPAQTDRVDVNRRALALVEAELQLVTRRIP